MTNLNEPLLAEYMSSDTKVHSGTDEYSSYNSSAPSTEHNLTLKSSKSYISDKSKLLNSELVPEEAYLYISDIVGFKDTPCCKFKHIIFCIFFNVFYAIFWAWFPDKYYFSRYSQTKNDQLIDAEYVLITDKSKRQTFCPIERLQPTANYERKMGVVDDLIPSTAYHPDPNGEDRMFIFRSRRYVYNSTTDMFELLNCPTTLDTETLRQRQQGVGLTRQQYIENAIFFGRNLLLVEAPTFLDLLVKELLHPFFVFQVYSVTLWCLENYYVFATVIGCMAITSVFVNIFDTRSNIRRLQSLAKSAEQITVIRDGTIQHIDTDQIVVGDLVIVKEGKVPCDMALIRGGAVINEAMLTGESVPVVKTPVDIPLTQSTADITRDRNLIYCGTNVLQIKPEPPSASSDSNQLEQVDPHASHVLAIVVKVGYYTTNGNLIASMMFPEETNFEFTRQTYKYLGALFCLATFGFAFTIWRYLQNNVEPKLIALRALDLVTIVIPPSLPLAMSMAINFSLGNLRRKDIFCINGSTIPIAGKVKVCCFDKTGTLTTDTLVVRGVYSHLSNLSHFVKKQQKREFKRLLAYKQKQAKLLELRHQRQRQSSTGSAPSLSRQSSFATMNHSPANIPMSHLSYKSPKNSPFLSSASAKQHQSIGINSEHEQGQLSAQTTGLAGPVDDGMQTHLMSTSHPPPGFTLGDQAAYTSPSIESTSLSKLKETMPMHTTDLFQVNPSQVPNGIFNPSTGITGVHDATDSSHGTADPEHVSLSTISGAAATSLQEHQEPLLFQPGSQQQQQHHVRFLPTVYNDEHNMTDEFDEALNILNTPLDQYDSDSDDDDSEDGDNSDDSDDDDDDDILDIPEVQPHHPEIVKKECMPMMVRHCIACCHALSIMENDMDEANDDNDNDTQKHIVDIHDIDQMLHKSSSSSSIGATERTKAKAIFQQEQEKFIDSLIGDPLEIAAFDSIHGRIIENPCPSALFSVQLLQYDPGHDSDDDDDDENDKENEHNHDHHHHHHHHRHHHHHHHRRGSSSTAGDDVTSLGSLGKSSLHDPHSVHASYALAAQEYSITSKEYASGNRQTRANKSTSPFAFLDSISLSSLSRYARRIIRRAKSRYEEQEESDSDDSSSSSDDDEEEESEEESVCECYYAQHNTISQQERVAITIAKQQTNTSDLLISYDNDHDINSDKNIPTTPNTSHADDIHNDDMTFFPTKDQSEWLVLRHFSFESSLQRMSVIALYIPTKQLYVFTKGAPEVLFDLTESVYDDSSTYIENYTENYDANYFSSNNSSSSSSVGYYIPPSTGSLPPPSLLANTMISSPHPGPVDSYAFHGGSVNSPGDATVAVVTSDHHIRSQYPLQDPQRVLEDKLDRYSYNTMLRDANNTGNTSSTGPRAPSRFLPTIPANVSANTPTTTATSSSSSTPSAQQSTGGKQRTTTGGNLKKTNTAAFISPEEQLRHSLMLEHRRKVEEYSRSGYRVLGLACREITLDDLFDDSTAQGKTTTTTTAASPSTTTTAPTKKTTSLADMTLREILDMVSQAFTERSNDTLRTICEHKLQFLGLLVFENQLKKTTTETIYQLASAGVRCVMITGDNIRTAVAVSKECGIIVPGTAVFVSEVKLRHSCRHLISKITEITPETHELLWRHSDNPKIRLDPKTFQVVAPRGVEITFERFELAVTGQAFKLISLISNQELTRILKTYPEIASIYDAFDMLKQQETTDDYINDDHHHPTSPIQLYTAPVPHTRSNITHNDDRHGHAASFNPNAKQQHIEAQSYDDIDAIVPSTVEDQLGYVPTSHDDYIPPQARTQDLSLLVPSTITKTPSMAASEADFRDEILSPFTPPPPEFRSLVNAGNATPTGTSSPPGVIAGELVVGGHMSSASSTGEHRGGGGSRAPPPAGSSTGTTKSTRRTAGMKDSATSTATIGYPYLKSLDQVTYIQRVLLSSCTLARFTPDQKALAVSELNKLGFYTMMTGDGANDTSALKSASVGVSLADTEASIAAPFTSRVTDISCVISILCEGRSALTSAFLLFRFMALYSFIQFFCVLLLYFRSGNLCDYQFLYQDLFAVFPLALVMARTAAATELSLKRPSGNLMSIGNIVGVFTHMCVSGILQWIVFYTTRYAPGYKIMPNVDNECEMQEATTVHYYVCLQYIVYAIIVSVGKRWKRYLFTNVPYVLVLILSAACSVSFLLFGPSVYLFFSKDDEPVNFTFKLLVVGFIAVTAIVAALTEFVFIPAVVWCVKQRQLQFRTNTVYGAGMIDMARGKPYHRIRYEFEKNWGVENAIRK